MATFLESANLAQYPPFRLRVRMAMLKTAVNVAAEAATADPDVDAARASLATRVLNAPAAFEDPFTWTVLTNATVADAGMDAPDGDLEFTVSSVWNAIAGA